MRKCKYDYIVGIDPDVDESGVAFLAVASRTFQLKTMKLPELLHAIPAYVDEFSTEEKPLSPDEPKKVAVVVELDRLHTHNWHLVPQDTRNSAASKGFDQGRCFQVAVTISEYFQNMGIEVIEKAPLLKIWGPKHDRKISHQEALALQGIHIITRRGQTNPEQRDAMLLALDISEIPIILDPNFYKNR